MDDFIEATKVGKYSVKVTYDPISDMESPREWEESTTFLTQHPRYISPDEIDGSGIIEHIARKFGVFEQEREWDGRFIYDEYSDDPDRIFKALDQDTIWLPVYAYEHGAIMYRAAQSNPFHCKWDSGMVGLIYMTKVEVRNEYGVKRISPKLREQVLKRLRSEVEEWSSWANGEVYSFTIEDENGEFVDSCGGWIGDPDLAMSEGISFAQDVCRNDRKRRQDRLKELIRNHVPLPMREKELAAA